MPSFSKVRRGVWPAVFGVAALLLTAGCRDASAPTGTEVPTPATPSTPNTPRTPNTPPRGAPIFISGVMTPQYQEIRVSNAYGPIPDAVVTVNGVFLPHCCKDLYSGYLPEALSAGSVLNLKVVAGGVKFEASANVLPTPTITAPAEGIPIPRADSVTLAWSIPLNPDLFEVCLNCPENPIVSDTPEKSLLGEDNYAQGNEREFKFFAGILADFSDGVPVAVIAHKGGFIKSVGSADADAEIRFVARSLPLIIKLKP